MTLQNTYVQEVSDALRDAKKVGINFSVGPDALVAEQIGTTARSLLGELESAAFAKTIPSESLATADAIKLVLQKVATTGGMIERGEATND